MWAIHNSIEPRSVVALSHLLLFSVGSVRVVVYANLVYVDAVSACTVCVICYAVLARIEIQCQVQCKLSNGKYYLLVNNTSLHCTTPRSLSAQVR